jgi:hypothetical protein
MRSGRRVELFAVHQHMTCRLPHPTHLTLGNFRYPWRSCCSAGVATVCGVLQGVSMSYVLHAH